MFQVSVRYAPAHELIHSLGVYLDRKTSKMTDLGPAWTARVQRQLSPAFAAQLEKRTQVDGLLLHLLADQHAGDGEPDVETFLQWLAALEPGELYERAAPHLPGWTPPADLRGYRDEAVALLRRWHEQYFATLDPAVLTGLAAEAARRKQLVQTQSPAEAVEAATNGILLSPDTSYQEILLIPGYHHRPANRFLGLRQLAIFLYSYEDPGSDLPLIRALRALPDESRIRILRYISREEHSFMEIVRHTGLALSTVHHHLVTLRAAGLVRVHETNPNPVANGQNPARYSFRPAALERLGQRLTEMIYGGDPE